MFAIGSSRKATCLLMLACSPIAFAQSAMAQTEQPSSAPAEEQEPAGVADIIVTAQRFTETAQRTPLILSVISADDLKGISDVRQLQSLNPGLQVASGGGFTQTFIRGVGSAVVVAGQESAIAYSADGVFLFTPSMAAPLMYDIERIEVLKGPQGTLYGRNATGGAINIITSGAKLGKVEGFVEGEIGNFDRWRATGAVNLPITDTLAVRFAGQHVEHGGYLSDGTDDQDLTSGRVRVRWEPSSAVTLTIGADVSTQRGNGPGSSLNPNPTNDKWLGGYDPRADTGPFFTGGTSLFSLPPNPAPYLKNDQWSVNAQLDVDIGFATLTILPAYRHEKADYLDYVPGFQDKQFNTTDEKTIEVRLANRSDRLKWVLGGYYIKNDQSNFSQVRQELFGTSFLANQGFDLNSYAFFGEATFSVSDQLRLIGGLRYTHEKTSTSGRVNEQFPPNTPAFNPFNPVTNPTGEFGDTVFAASASANAVTWKAGAELDVSPSSMLFATASRGFKGGGNYVNPGFDSTYKPEYLTAFELGSRNRFFDNTLQINGELFYWKLKDQQQTFLSLNQNNFPVLATVNAGKAHMYGGSVDIVWKPTPNDTLRGAVEYTHSKYDSFSRILPAFAVFPSTVCTVTPGGVGPFAPTTVDCAGQPVLRAPKWVASAGYEHRFELGNGNTVTFNGDMTYGSGRYLTLNYTPLAYQESYALFNASLTYEASEIGLTVTGWIRNIGDKRVMANADQFVDFYSRPPLMPPRTFGGSIRYAF